MSTDNNFLLIILIAIIIFWINCINTTSPKDKYEKFGEVQSPLLSQTTQITSPPLNNLSIPQASSNSVSFSNNINVNPNQDLLNKPPLTNLDAPALNSSYNSMAKQYIGNDKQPMYSDLSSNPDKQDGLFSTMNSNSYMLLSPDSMPDDKFKKVLEKDPPRKVLGSGDLLPKDENKDWFQVPNSKFNLMQAIDLEVPEIKIGIDTVGQSRKNATYDLRAAPPNPKFVVSPWSNSTIEPDYNTKSLC
jgi:hypothetical protein